MSNNVAILWTGGKDCALAFLKALNLGYDITFLVTFALEKPNLLESFLIKEETDYFYITNKIVRS